MGKVCPAGYILAVAYISVQAHLDASEMPRCKKELPTVQLRSGLLLNFFREFDLTYIVLSYFNPAHKAAASSPYDIRSLPHTPLSPAPPCTAFSA